MLTLSIRDFQLKASDYLDKLPLELTRYGKVVCLVISKNQSVNTAPIKSVNTIKPSVPVISPIKKSVTVTNVTVKPTPPTPIIRTMVDISQDKVFAKSKFQWLCPHGMPGRLCREQAHVQEAIKREGHNA